MSYRTQTDVIAEHLTLSGMRVIDVGSGEGALVRWLRSQGADSVGAECGPVMLERALLADPEHPEAHIDAVGQDLPFPDESADIVIMSYSLHHIPGGEMMTALSEAHRVLRSGGKFYVVEPVAEGPSQQVIVLVDDETEVRANAQAALAKADEVGFQLVAEGAFDSVSAFPDIDAWAHVVVGVDPSRAEAFEENQAGVEAAFNEWGTPTPDGMSFVQPNVFKLFTKP